MFHMKQHAPGRMVTVGDQRIHVVVSGAGPTVVLCGGLASNWFDWDDVLRILSDFHTVVVFDRPGFGLSGPPPRGQLPTVTGEADRILDVLDALGLEGPAVVVGHSLAGFYAEAFARLHPHRTSGVLLLDSSVGRDPWRAVPPRVRVALAHILAAIGTRTGLQRVLGPTTRRVLNHSIPPDGTPIETLDWVARIYRTPSYLDAALVENFVHPDLAAELDALRSQATLHAPVTVAAAHTGRSTPWGWAWIAQQRRLARRLNAQFTVVNDAHHHAMIDQPLRVAALISELVSSSKDTNT